MCRYAITLALLIVPASLCAQPAKEVASFMEARSEAFASRDAEATAALYADDAIIINVAGDQHTGRPAIAAFYRQLFDNLLAPGQGPDLGSGRCEEATTQIIGDDVAIITQECTLYDVMPEEEAEGRRLPIRQFRATHVLADRGDGWRIVAFRNIPIWNPFAWEGPNKVYD